MKQIQVYDSNEERPRLPISVVCVKWGTPYSADYVNTLQRAVQDNLSYPHRFVCITDTAEGLTPEVEVLPLPEIPIDKNKWGSGYWPKLAIFKKGCFAEDELILYLDVDIVINQSLNAFVDLIDEQGGLRIIREWNPDVWNILPVWMRPDRGGNGSAIGFLANEQTHLFEEFAKAPEAVDSQFCIDQNYITLKSFNHKYWPNGWCVSFRKACVPHWPMNYFARGIKKPLQSKIIVFHGLTNPTDLIENGDYRWGRTWRYGHGPVKWVQNYWQKYSKAA